LDSCWALLKGYRKVAGKCPKAIRKPLDNFRGYRKAIENCPNSRLQPIGEKAELHSGYQKKRGNFDPFSLKRCVSAYYD
jgi:hypothetical protein